MKQKVMYLLGILFVLVPLVVPGQAVRMIKIGDAPWNPNYIHGPQLKDAEGNPRWNADGTPMLGWVKCWTGDAVDGQGNPLNPDGNPVNVTNYSGVHGWGSPQIYRSFGGLGCKYSEHQQGYFGGQWLADRRASEGKQPVSAEHPVILNFDLGAVYDVADLGVWNWAAHWPPETYSLFGAKDVTIKFKVAEGAAWETLGSFVLGYPPKANNNYYGAYRVTNLHNGPEALPSTGKPFELFVRPITVNKTARFFRFEIVSNWGQGKENDPGYVGISEVMFWKQGPYLTFDQNYMNYGNRFKQIYPGDEVPIEWGYPTAASREMAILYRTEDLWMFNEGGSAPGNDIIVTGLSGPALEPDSPFKVTPPAGGFPLTIPGNTEVALGLAFEPATFGEHASKFAIHFQHEGKAEEYVTTFSLTGKYLDPVYGNIPVVDAKGSAGYPGFSDVWYLVRAFGSLLEKPALGWISGTRLAWNEGSRDHRGFLAEGVPCDKHWFKFDLGKEFGTTTENGAMDEMWVWPSRWYGGTTTLKKVKVYYSNDPAAWDYDQDISPDTVPNLTGWTFLSDEEFPLLQAPYTVQHKVDFSKVPGPYRYVRFNVDGPPGEGNWGAGSFTLGAVRFYQRGASLLVAPDGYNWGEAKLYSTTSTQFVLGNVGDPGFNITIDEVRFVTERGWEGGGYFSLPDVDGLGLPKVYAPGTTETFTVEFQPRDVGDHRARLIVISHNDAGLVNAWELEVKGKVIEYATGFIRGVKATANAQYDTGAWAAQAAVNSYGIQEPDGLNWDVSTHIGSKQAKHWYGGWAWLMGATQRISEAWIECDLGGVYSLDEMWLWNASWNDMNQFYGPESAIKTTYIEYRQDAGDSWKQLGGDDMFYTFFGLGDKMWATNPYPATNLVDGDSDETNNPPVSFGGVNARYVRISTAGGHDVGSWGDSIFAICIAELRFYSKPAGLTVSPQILNFGSNAVGVPRVLTFDIENDGGSPVTIDMIAALGLNSPYTVTDPTGPVTIPAGSARTVRIKMDATEVGNYDDFKIGIISTLGVIYVQVNGASFIAGTPDLELNPMSLNFGLVYLPIDGSAPAPTVLPVEISNYGDVALEVSSIATLNTAHPAGSDTAFTADKTDATVAAQASPTAPGMGTLNVSFVPLAAGNYNGQVVLESNDPDESPTTVTLTGSAAVTQPASVEAEDWMLY